MISIEISPWLDYPQVLTSSKASSRHPRHPRYHQDTNHLVNTKKATSRWCHVGPTASDAPMMTVMTHEAERIPSLICFDDL